MRKVLFTLLLFIGVSTAVTATPLLTESKISGFHPWSDDLREIYGDTWPNYQLELNYHLWRYLYGWGSIGYIQKHGRSLGSSLCSHQPTTIRLAPGTLGIKLFSSSVALLPRWNDQIDFYLGVGARYFSLEIKNDSNFVSRGVSKRGWGSAFTGGVLFRLSKRWVFDTFVDLSFKRMDFTQTTPYIQRHNIDVGGISFGIGMGMFL